jgi:hypothetical protein
VAVEALLLVVAELMAIPLLVAAALLFEVAGLAVIGLGALLVGRRARPTALVRWWRRGVWTLTGVLGFLLAALVFVDLALYEPGLRLLLGQVERSSGVDLYFERARGNIFTGEVHLEGVTIRHHGAGADVDLSIERLDIDIAMLRLFEPRVPITGLELHGVRGALVREGGRAAERRRGRGFVIEQLIVDDLAVDFEDRAVAPIRLLPVAVDHLEIAPLRSDAALVDLLCHTSARGRARGNTFVARPGAWSVDHIPLGLQDSARLGTMGKWLRGGQLDVDLTCLDAGADPLALGVDVGLSGFQVAPPEGTGRRALAQKIAAAVTRVGPRVELHLRLEIDRGRLVGVASASEIGLLDLGIQEYNLELGKRLGLGRDELYLLGVGSRAAEAARQRLHARQH